MISGPSSDMDEARQSTNEETSQREPATPADQRGECSQILPAFRPDHSVGDYPDFLTNSYTLRLPPFPEPCKRGDKPNSTKVDKSQRNVGIIGQKH